MCVPYDSRPPVSPISGAAVATRDLTLTSTDNTKFAAFFAGSGGAGGPAVVVMPDVRGLFPFYEELAVRFAERGLDAVAIDYFGRTAGVAKRDKDFPYMEHIPRTTVPHLTADVGAAVGYLRGGTGNSTRPVFTVGFCFGGSNSWLQAAGGHGLAGVIGFYGHPTRPGRDGSPPVIDRVTEFKCPVLGLMGGADQGIPAEEVARYETALRKAGIRHEIHTYPGAPHSFFDRRYQEFAGESADAWERVHAFIAKNSR
jgi:carboxymethylenebutenolidase